MNCNYNCSDKVLVIKIHDLHNNWQIFALIFTNPQITEHKYLKKYIYPYFIHI